MYEENQTTTVQALPEPVRSTPSPEPIRSNNTLFQQLDPIIFPDLPPNLLPFRQGDTVKILNNYDNLQGTQGIIITVDRGWVYLSTATRVIKRSILNVEKIEY